MPSSLILININTQLVVHVDTLLAARYGWTRAGARQRSSDAVIEEIVQLRRLGFRFIALANDNFYPVTICGGAPGRTARYSRRTQTAASGRCMFIVCTWAATCTLSRKTRGDVPKNKPRGAMILVVADS